MLFGSALLYCLLCASVCFALFFPNPTGLVELVNRCLAFSAADRPEFREVLALLESEYRALRARQPPRPQQKQQQQVLAKHQQLQAGGCFSSQGLLRHFEEHKALGACCLCVKVGDEGAPMRAWDMVLNGFFHHCGMFLAAT